jgi:hypothetical protein
MAADKAYKWKEHAYDTATVLYCEGGLLEALNWEVARFIESKLLGALPSNTINKEWVNVDTRTAGNIRKR